MVIYPNPINDKIYLELSKDLQNKPGLVYIVSDLMARPVLRGEIKNKLSIIPISKLIKGGYFLTIYENKKLIEVKKFIRN